MTVRLESTDKRPVRGVLSYYGIRLDHDAWSRSYWTELVGRTHLTLVPVEETIARVLCRPRRLGHPDLPDDAHVGPGDDEQREEILHGDEVQPIDVTEIDAGETRVDRATERLEAAAPRRDERHPEDDGRGDAGEHAEDPHDRHDGAG